jgi:hypothetical protein
MKWSSFAFIGLWIFVPFAMMGEGLIGCIVLGGLAILNQCTRSKDRNEGYEKFNNKRKIYKESVLEEMR